MLSDLHLRLKALLRRGVVESDLDDELRFHYDQKIAKLVASGVPPAEAARRARLAFGGLDQVKEECRQARGVDFVDTLLQDLRFGCRTLAKDWRVTAVVVVSVALGVAANTTVFGWIRATLLDPLPGVAQSGRLAALETLTPAGQPVCSSFLDYRDFRDQTKLLAGVVAFRPRMLSMGDANQAQGVRALMVSANYFDVLGIKAARGRFFSPAEQADKPDAFPVAVISSALWRRAFGADPRIAGRMVRLNRKPFTIVGVAPEDFRGTMVGSAFDLYVPVLMEGTLEGDGGWIEDRKSRPLDLMARLRSGVGAASARAEVAAIAARLARAYPRTNEGIGAALVPVEKAFYGLQSGVATLLLVSMGVSLIVLAIVCANVGNLLLARALGRRRETSIRAALGASRRRLLRQLLTECLLLAVAGGGAGVLCSLAIAGAIERLASAAYTPLGSLARLDGQVLGFAFLLTLLTGLVFGFAPALHATRPELHAALKEGGRGPGMGARTRRLRALFVVSEVALALLTLTGAGLLLKSYQKARLFNPGFDVRQVLLARFDLSTRGYGVREGLAFDRELAARLRALPGVEAVSYAEDVPLGFSAGSWEDLRIAGYVPRASESMKLYRNLVAPGYFDLLRIPLAAGRDFAVKDDGQAPPVAIVNETFARRYFGHRSPLGRTFEGWGRTLTIVGMARDIKYHSLEQGAEPYFYVPFAQFYHADTTTVFHLRAAAGFAALAPAIRAAARRLDPAVAVAAEAPLADFIGASYFRQKVTATLLTGLGLLALLLAVLGLYSVIAYEVTQWTHEIGIRMALGARRRDVLRLVVGQGMRLTGIGVGLGLAAAFGATRLMKSLLFGVSATDPAIFAGIAALLAAVACIACFLPARRATLVDPMIALRHD